MSESRLPHGAQQDQPPREPVHRLIAVPEALQHGLRRRRAIVAIGERRDPARDQLLELLPPRSLHETGHAALLPNRLRNASMNGSRSPSRISISMSSSTSGYTITDANDVWRRDCAS